MFSIGPADASGVRSLEVRGRIGEPVEAAAVEAADRAAEAFADEGHASVAVRATNSGDGYITLNGTDIHGGELKALDFKMPKGTSDAAGIAQCAAVCSNHSECGAYVFVSQSGPTPGGPRCALKAVGACALHPRKGVFSGYKNSSCHHAPTPPTTPVR